MILKIKKNKRKICHSVLDLNFDFFLVFSKENHVAALQINICYFFQRLTVKFLIRYDRKHIFNYLLCEMVVKDCLENIRHQQN